MRRAFLPLLILIPLAGCDGDNPQSDDYYTRVIQPILTNSCATGTSGCHRADPADQFSFAAGNLDLSSFENVHKRPDLLRTYGAYPAPLLLIKAVGATDELSISYRDVFLPVEIEHASGGVFTVGSPAYLTLQTWLANGATRDGNPPPAEPVIGEGECTDLAPPPEFDEAALIATPQWQTYNDDFDDVMAVMEAKGCSARNCHGAPQSDFFIGCDTPALKPFNFQQVWSFVADPADDSDLVRRPLDPQAGGLAHTGGVHWGSNTDPDYLTLRDFAAAVGPLEFGVGDPGKTFFADNVMPVFLKRGCAAEGCHSPAAMNDFKLRAGGHGFFSAISLERNYDLAKREFMAFEVPDVRRGRLVAKGILPFLGGIDHRGGAVLETPNSGGADPANCPAVFDPTGPAFCAFVEWARIERAALLAAGEIDALDAGQTVPIVYVDRQASHVAGPLQFATYQPSSDLMVRAATIDGTGAITAVGAPQSLLDNCAGAASRAVVDVQGPDVRNDGTTVAFAMRTAAGAGFQIYTVNIDGTNCQALTPAGAVNRFDPAWSPDGEWIVYASTEVSGTTKRLALPQSDLWRMRADGTGGERITFLSNSEVQPAMMREGRITMTTEKVDPRDTAGGFYQLAGRRLNWDLTDYHPLLGQRAVSPFQNQADPTATAPSFGYNQVTEIREALDGNFLVVLSDAGAVGGAGTLGIFNRSIGPIEAGRTDPGYLPSLTIPDPAATGRGATNGAYRSPFMLLDGQIMVSYAAGSFDLNGATSLDWDIVALDPRTGARTTIAGGAGAQVEAVLALKYPARKLFVNRRQLVFGGAQNLTDPAHATVHFPDAPMLATLLGANLRRGRPVSLFRDADTLAVLDSSGNQVGTVALAADGSARIRAPSGTPVVIELRRGATALFTMTEEHQFGPGETISLGVGEGLFDAICAGCHGSVSGSELDVAVTPDALTGASISISATASPTPIGP